MDSISSKSSFFSFNSNRIIVLRILKVSLWFNYVFLFTITKVVICYKVFGKEFKRSGRFKYVGTYADTYICRGRILKVNLFLYVI